MEKMKMTAVQFSGCFGTCKIPSLYDSNSCDLMKSTYPEVLLCRRRCDGTGVESEHLGGRSRRIRISRLSSAIQ